MGHRPGDVIAGRFEIRRSAGSGGMGVVYQAHDRETGREVALKILLAQIPEQLDRFAHEIELLSLIEHPHIIGYIAHGASAEGSPYVVMPWLEGEDLQDRIQRGRLSVEDTLTVAQCVADALACLHGRGLVHRDIKPSNLFLPHGDVTRLQVIDLGVARTCVPTRPLTETGALVGTPGFMAPEQARGDELELTPAADIFAVGCVLYECVTGERLFSGVHTMAVLAKILLEDPPRARERRSEVPDALDLLIHRMVSKDPERRPRDGAELGAWLKDLSRVTPIPTRSPPHSLTSSEQRVVTGLVVVLPATNPASEVTHVTRRDGDPFGSASFGVHVHPLDDRTGIALGPEGLSAADQASVLARFARHLATTFPGASVALATGSAATGPRLPVGEAIDRGVSIVKKAVPGGGVHTDDVTAALLTSRFDVLRDGERLLVGEERLSLDPTRRVLGRPTSCVGRDREFAILEATFAECVEGSEPKVVLVTGAPGGGKSRLRHEFLRRLRSKRGRRQLVLQCRGDPLHVATPYAQVAQAVRQAVVLAENESPEIVRDKLRAHVTGLFPADEVLRITDFLGELLGAHFPDNGRLPLRAARHHAVTMADQVCRAFEDVVRAWCRREPTVLVLEDLQWADAASVKLVDAALRKLQDAPLLVLALARPEFEERFPGIWENRHPTLIRLPPLPEKACAKLVREVLGPEASATSVRHIVERSEGNAFFLEELIRTAAEHGFNPSRPPSSGRDPMPQTVIALSQARLQRLDPLERKVLRAASVFGDVFWVEGVRALLTDEPNPLQPVTQSLLEKEAIVPVDRPHLARTMELRFRHSLLRAAAYATLTEEDRTLGHRLAAGWLSTTDEDREVVALHWLEAGNRARAADCFAQAGKGRWMRAQADAAARCALRALLVGDPDDVVPDTILQRVRLLADALEATRTVDPRDVLTGVERHVKVPDAQSSSALHLVDVAIERALAAIRRNGEASVRLGTFARAACAVGALSGFDQARNILKEATTLGAKQEQLLHDVRFASAKVGLWAYEYRSLVDIVSSGVLPSDWRERLEMLIIHATTVVATRGREALEEALGYIARAEALADAAGEDPVAKAHCQKARVLTLYYAGDHVRVAEAVAAAIRLARKNGLRYEECVQLHNAGEIYVRLNNPERARNALTASNELAADIGAERTRLHNDALLAYLDANADRLAELANQCRQMHNSWHELRTLYWLGLLLASRRDPRARRELERAHQLAEHHGVRMMAEECAAKLAEV